MGRWREMEVELLKYKNIRDPRIVAKLKVSEPPCAKCAHFDPILLVGVGKRDGEIACWADEMKPDFSCFQSKMGKEVDVKLKRRRDTT